MNRCHRYPPRTDEPSTSGPTPYDIFELEIQRWQKLFRYTRYEASRALIWQFTNRLWVTLSDHKWELVRTLPEAAYHDQESYSHLLVRRRLREKAKQRIKHDKKKDAKKYENLRCVVGLSPILPTLKVVASYAKLRTTPKFLPKPFPGSLIAAHATTPRSVVLRASAMQIVFADRWPWIQATFRVVTLAEKDLSTVSIAPTLGRNATLPHLRLGSASTIPRPAQNEYPVWYFFYGLLGNSNTLAHLLEIPAPGLRVARVTGGITVSSRNQRAMFDGSEDDKVEGWAYQVMTREDEDILRIFARMCNEVVRCRIRFRGEGKAWDGGEVDGLTFRHRDDMVNASASSNLERVVSGPAGSSLCFT
jgi:hypothetical protein